MPGKIGRFEVLRTLGSGASCKVKLGLDTESGRKVAIKVMNDNMDAKMKELVMNEVQAMQSLKHDNVISQIEFGAGIYEKSSGKKKEVSYIVLELAIGGELFDFVAISGRFEEPLARYFFKQFMAGLSYTHEAGISHRDLKPENLLLDKSYTLKIADFGFAAPVEGKDGSGYLTSKLGTLNYMAPEIHLKQPYQGKSVDLFAAAIILFIMVAQHPPFTTAQPQDPFYRCLAANRADIFWRTHCKNKPSGETFFSEDFKDLVQCMLQLDPSHRPSAQEVLNHPWMQGPMPTTAQVFQEFERRNQAVKQSVEQERKQKEAEKLKRVEARKEKVMRSANVGGEEAKLDTTDEALNKPKKQLEDYVHVFNQKTHFFSTYNPDMIEDALTEYLKNQVKLEPKVHDHKYKVKFTLQSKDQGDQAHETEICMRIMKAEGDKVCVEFSKLSGNQIRFHDHFKEIKDKVLNFANDANLEAEE
eukprot:CAMPEP_0170481584 /NCGR_PEP_ID=MMETSP0208-20121228/1965_1 /TAXON_ID=197538 /ORGANISM="Strombidium inclinatum, Strain S3" /LENGTH=472 /DNA_ID=CAMNT_0010754319 /DNA_START=29 /DNA_END=1447 /DNA_ORIENTATION=-